MQESKCMLVFHQRLITFLPLTADEKGVRVADDEQHFSSTSSTGVCIYLINSASVPSGEITIT